MFAYGASETGADGTPGAGEVVCEPVNLVTGPGNIYVVAAKRLLKGLIGIDSEAGPTEIAVLADDSADPEHVAADLISQAEHDVLAAVGPGHRQRAAGRRGRSRRWRSRVAATKHHERVRTALTGAPVRHRARRRRRRRPRRSSTPTPPSTWRSRPATRPRSRRG